MSLALSVAEVAPLYNLGLIIIAVYLFIKLFSTPIKDRRVYMTPWKFLFVGVIVFIIEELLTVFRSLGLINIPRHINGFFEFVIIITFIYTLLLQKERLKSKN